MEVDAYASHQENAVLGAGAYFDAILWLRGQNSMDKSSGEWCRLNFSHVRVLQRLEICALNSSSGLSAVHVAISFSLFVKREHVKTVSGLANDYLANLPKSFTLTVVWGGYKGRAIIKSGAR